MRIAFLAIDTQWVDPAGEFVSFTYGARKLEASVRSAPDLAHVETVVIDLEEDNPDAFMEAIRAARPTLVAASLYVWSVATFLEVARRVKAWDPSVRVVLGGASARASVLGLPRYRPLLRYVDAIATGEGEEVIRALARGDALASIPGLLLPHALGLRTTAPAVRPELDAYPSPYQLGTAPEGHTGYIETFRGCPISCAFCQWGEQRSDRVYGAEYLASHLRGLAASRAQNVFFNDAAFNLSARAFRNLMEAEREVKLLSRSTVHGHFYPTHLKPEHLDFLELVGHAQVAIGIQSFDPEVLKRLGRPFDPARFETVLTELRARGIGIDLELIFGLPGDTPESFRRTLARSIELADSIKVFKPLVLPDALLERVEEFGIRYDPDTFVVEECAGWTAHDLEAGWEEALRASEGFEKRMAAPTWLGFNPRASRRRGGAGRRVSTQHLAALAAQIGLVAGWTVSGGRHEHGSLLLDLVSPGGPVVLEVKSAVEGRRSFASRGGLAYSYRGSIAETAAAGLGRVIEAIHPATAEAVAATA